MTLLLKQIFSFIKVLNSDVGEKPIAWGIVCGMFLGFSPGLSLQTLLIIFLMFFFRVQVGAALCAAFFFKILSFALDPVFDVVGGGVLELGFLKGLYTMLYNAPIIPFTKFYNSIVMGSAVFALILTPFVYVFALKIIVKYRVEILAKFQETKFFKALKATSLYKWYAKYQEFYG